METPLKPYARLATPSDLDELARVQLRAFTPNSLWNWVQSVKHPLELATTEEPSSRLGKDERTREKAMRAFASACLLKGGRIYVVILPGEPGAPDKIVAGGLWLPPGKRLHVTDIPVMTKSGLFDVVRKMGLPSVKKLVLVFQDRVEKVLHKAFKKRGLPPAEKSAWYLQLLFTDPDHQGKGYSRFMLDPVIKEAAETNIPLHLEASDTRARDLYSRNGFEVVEVLTLGKGKVDANGLPARGLEATGIQSWVMIKWP